MPFFIAEAISLTSHQRTPFPNSFIWTPRDITYIELYERSLELYERKATPGLN